MQSDKVCMLIHVSVSSTLKGTSRTHSTEGEVIYIWPLRIWSSSTPAFS